MTFSILTGKFGGNCFARLFFSTITLGLFAAVTIPGTGQAGGWKDGQIERPWYAISELRVGGFFHSIETESKLGEGGGAVNLEVLFGRIGPKYESEILRSFFNPKPHIGAMINVEGNTSNYYAGLTWQWNLTSWAFIEGSFGGAIHDGPNDDPIKASYGCTLNFRESGSLGFSLSDEWNLLFTVDHMSNGGLCDKNKGLTNVGARLGYKW